MANSKIQDFFNRKFFEIPKYQRGYAWNKENVRDLFNDIREAEEVKSSHYIGTVVLSKSKKSDRVFFIVDGQQRTTTITMIINALIKKLSKDDAAFYKRFYITENDVHRLKPLGKEKEFFEKLLNEKSLEPKNKSQRLLIEAYEEIEEQIEQIKDPLSFLNMIESLEILEFIEESEGDAIRIFQTVNDRGKPLSNMEKAKSLLVYFSNRYLEKKLDDKINDAFGEIFQMYDEIKFKGEELGITLIGSDKFSEDTVMRYHFVAYNDEDYDATAGYVLNFLKKRLNSYRKVGKNIGYQKVEDFINDYMESLRLFFESLNNLIKRADKKRQYFKLFAILNLSATVYPLIVKLEMLGRLENKLPSPEYKKFTFLDLIELIDVRIYKTRNTDPRAEISRFACGLNEKTTDEQIQNWLLWYNKQWMSKPNFVNYLNGYIYGNRALPHIFIDYSEHLSGTEFTMEELKKIANDRRFNPTIEHILSQKPKFTLKSHGFKSTEEYLEYEDSLGNLCVLEKNLNSGAQNKSTFEKVTVYDKSIFKMTKNISSQISINREFKKKDIEERTELIADYLVKKWWC
ncbi:uncharacterized protein with ParB-like and HNH nuclease domain [Flavobacterium arsenatis]|uniref:Uncharacterized protein with ParB-like and HNH nuclease domain n=1 Tax=Flavobacterium arsenatis TaxID=1484332 RepID=A0ABU1TSI5_9FLAO|nr:DUF262 domain-containing HNH endonuclease family protein [Flavobacterium arsenatis]MDR6968834.1 uncharacterized protein with ParB-like and HNH nuclease domain [Flavobacterium arsenatis]